MRNLFGEVKAMIYPLAKVKEKEKNMIVDCNNQEQIRGLGFRVNKKHERVFISGNGEYGGIVFRNFPTVTTDGANFTGCIFENTQAIEFSRAKVKNCTFRNVSEISGHFTDFSGCTFVRCHSQGPFLTVDYAGSVEGCTFQTVTALGRDGYVIYSIYGRKKDVREIKRCKFIDCRAESRDGLITYASYYTSRFSHKTKEIENVDLRSCDFGGVDSVCIGSFETGSEEDQ